jgi:hypothetical protein
MRFQIILPILNVILASICFHMGDVQAERIWKIRSHTGFVEPVPDSYARARYVDYALNAPAWATLGAQAGMLQSRSTYWTGRDLRYFLALIVMWYLIGSRVDENRANKERNMDKWMSLQNRASAAFCALYGLFLCYLMLPEVFPLRGYGQWLPNRKYELWFVGAVIVWGIGMTLFGSSSFLRHRSEVQKEGDVHSTRM